MMMERGFQRAKDLKLSCLQDRLVVGEETEGPRELQGGGSLGHRKGRRPGWGRLRGRHGASRSGVQEIL